MQTLKLIQKGDRTKPTIYKLGSSEILCLHRDHLGTIEICDTQGRFIRSLTRYDLLDWGYSPAKLAAGNEDDQFVDDHSEPLVSKVAKAIKVTALATVAGVVIGFAGNATGCTEYVLKQADRDIATTTIAPVENMQRQIEFKAAEKHANEFLAKNNKHASR